MIGQSVSHFRVCKLIGRSESSEVYLADDSTLDRQVAIKFLSPHRRSDEVALRRFRSEALTVSALDHPHIATVHLIDQDDSGRPYMVMPYYPGGSLMNLLASGRLDPIRALTLTIQILDGLSAAHSRGIIHRDLKPANVMLANDGSVRIIDFGLAKLTSHEVQTQSGILAGTAAYASPELARGESVDSRSDLFSVGIILFELLTNRLPFSGNNEAAILFSIVGKKPRRLSDHLDRSPPRLQAVLDRALAKDPARRYQAAAEMAGDLDRIRQACIQQSIRRPATAKKGWRIGSPAQQRRALVLTGVMVAVAFTLALVRDMAPDRRSSRLRAAPRKRIDVPADISTLAAALNAAGAGDTVLVAAGTYLEHNLAVPAGVTLRGATGNPDDVIIDARRRGWILQCDHLDSVVHIADLTLTGGFGAEGFGWPYGGALTCRSSRLVMEHCRLVANKSDDGGAIFLEDGAVARIEACGFEHNVSHNTGACISCRDGARLLLGQCELANNEARYRGGTVFIQNAAAHFVDCRLRGNLAPDGAAVYAHSASIRMERCLVYGNACSGQPKPSGDFGAVLQFRSDRGSELLNCTIADNHVTEGSGTVLIQDGHLVLGRTIIWGTRKGRAIFLGLAGTADLTCCDLSDNAGGDFCADLAPLSLSAGNVSLDPLFVNPKNGDYRLQTASPCAGHDPSSCGVLGALPPAVSESE